MANQSLGRGELHFARFKTGTQIPDGERYLGNSPEFNLTIENENLDHFSSDRGVREKDFSIVLQSNRTGSLTLDEIVAENIALFFQGKTEILTTAAVTSAATEEFEGVHVGYGYQLGVTSTTPAGIRSVDDVTVTNGAVAPATLVTYVVGEDYVIDEGLGRITILAGGDIEEDDDITVSYKVEASERFTATSGTEPVEGALRYIARNPHGMLIDYYMPYVKLTPNGDLALKSEEWQTIPLSVEILRRGELEAIYLDGRPYTPTP